MNYQDIAKANSEISPLNLKGKDYAQVADRVTAFRKLFPEGFITTDIISNEGGVVLMKATVGYYRENGTLAVLGTGYAREEQGKGLVNGTSHIENCETSAVGRALGFLGLGLNGGGICSAEELVNAIAEQGQTQNQSQKRTKTDVRTAKPQQKAEPQTQAKQEPKPEPKPEPKQEPKPEPKQEPKQEPKPETKAVPEQKPEAQPVTAFLKTAIRTIREQCGVTQQQVSEAWNQLMQDGVIPFKSSSEFTYEEAETLIQALGSYFQKG
jgi:hypothetical protein